MKVEARLHFRDRDRWASSSGTNVRGAAFLGDLLLRNKELAHKLQNIASPVQFREVVGQLNGFFALIHDIGNGTICAAVDRSRSIPLFYAQCGEKVVISDDAQWVFAQTGDEEYDRDAATEFVLTSYVTGRDTLYPSVKQLLPGEMLTVDTGVDNTKHCVTRYSRFLHLQTADPGVPALLDKLDKAVHSALQHLVDYAGGRLIAVPLSGGCDSTMIVLALKRLGYGNILCYSYGRPGNPESKRSRQLAEHLGLMWEFVPYSDEKWHSWFSSEERKRYYRYASGLCALPNLQDWPAVISLKTQGLIPANTVFTPGHSADVFCPDFVAAQPAFRSDRLDPETVVKQILTDRYSLWPWPQQRKALSEMLQARITKASDGFADCISNAAAYEAWDAQEFFSKFVTNSVRGYEFWGYDWWLPLKDNEFADFWLRVPVRYRFKRTLTALYVASLLKEVAGAGLRPLNFGSSSSWLRNFMSLAKTAAAHIPWIKHAYGHFRGWQRMRPHPLAFYGPVPEKLRRQLFHSSIIPSSFYALEHLGLVSFNEDTPPADAEFPGPGHLFEQY